MQYTRHDIVLHAVEECKRYAAEHDDELAHVFEKKAWHQALLAVREGEPEALEAVEAALTTRDISFARWFA